MRQRIFGVLACTTIIAIGGAAYALQAGQYRNIPGAVTGTYSGGINGTFKFVPAIAPDGIPSAPNGGACIIFRARDLGFKKMWAKHCKIDDDCSTPGENAYGYCEVKKGKCWARPDPAKAPGSDEALCRRGNKLPSPVPINTDLDISITTTGAPTPAPISTPSWKIKHNAKARVVSRLNCPPTSPGCAPGGHDYILEWGPVTKL